MLIILTSYQEYMVKCARNNSGNWDFKFYNITYEQAKEIEKNKNIKEIGKIYKLGITKSISENPFGKTDIELRAYDRKALEHINLNIVEGRSPESSNEIIVQKTYGDGFKIDEKINLTIDNKTKEYTIVGLAKEIDFNQSAFGSSRYAAITYTDKEIIEDGAKINVTGITKNIKNIYNTVDSLTKNNENVQEKVKGDGVSVSEIFTGIIKEENEELVIFEYNEDVLNYVGISRENREFTNRLNIIKVASVAVIMVISIAVIQTSFKMSYEERLKEYGMLSSIGMNKEQISKIIEKEAFGLGTIGILIGYIIGISVSRILIYFIDKLIRTTVYDVNPYRILNMNVELTLKMPFLILLLIFLIIYIIVFVSCELPMRRLNKITIIEAIKNSYRKRKNKKIRTPKIIDKMFKEEGVLAYKNARKNKIKYKTIIISITASIVLFLIVSGLIANIFRGSDNEEYDYRITLISDVNNYENNRKELIKYLEDNEFINSYSINDDDVFSNKEIISTIIKLETDKALELDEKIGKNRCYWS